MAQFPPDQSLASRSVVNTRRRPRERGSGAGCSEDAGRVIEPRKTSSLWSEDNFPTKREGKPTLSPTRKAEVLGAHSTTMGAGMRTVSKEKDRPPYPKVRASPQSTTVVLKSGACIQRGSSGTCEVRLFPRVKGPEEKGYR